MNQTELDFRARPESRRITRSQEAMILDELNRHAGQWVPMPRLVQVSGAYAVHSRISDLRKRGIAIEHRNQWEAGACHSFYRIP